MKVFKFGGASVKDAEGVKNVARVLKHYPDDDLAIVVSAMGKTTNALEKVTGAYFYKNADAFAILDEVKKYHFSIIKELFPDEAHPIYNEVSNCFVEIEWVIEDAPTGTYDFEYDQVVSQGEVISSRIVSAYLNDQGIENKWVDVRDFLRTDNTYREGKVRWELTAQLAEKAFRDTFLKKFIGPRRILTQGFIGGTSENYTTTLGREGSDYTAAIIAHIADAESVTIWKDVPGVLNADPKFFNDTVMLRQLSYQDAIELAYYGATVIHPKTIKPLQNKNIPLYVKSFLSPEDEGTVISKELSPAPVPSFIFKTNQVLLSMMPKDFSFIAEENLSAVFTLLAQHHVKINVMQNTALSFSICIDYDEKKTPALKEALQEQFKLLYNKNTELITIRNYDQPTIQKALKGREVLLELRSRNTVQMVVKNNF